MVQIPHHFQPLIEEYVEQDNGTGEAIFSWTNEKQDEDIMIQLDFAGNLTSLTIDLHDEDVDVPLNEAKRRELAEQFLLSHYPDALTDLTLYKTKQLTRAQRFYYEQLVMDLPLDCVGCFIDIDSAGNVVEFRFEAIKKVPEIPQSLISKDKLMENLKSRLDFQLTIANLLVEVYDVAEAGLRLVYEPVTFAKYKADVMEPTLTIVHEEEVETEYAALPPISKEIARDDLTIEKIIGITERMEIIREVDMGEETGIVWRDRDWEMNEGDLTWNGLFIRRTEDTVKAFISKKTGKVRSFIWFNQRSGNLQLTREECYLKAIKFLQRQLPDYYQYLQLIVREEEEENDDSNKSESFTFHMHYGKGIMFQLEMIMVNVNCNTGLIDHYSGPRFEIEQLNQIPDKPAISQKEAVEIFINHLDFDLEWNKNYESETEEYNLVYRVCNRESRTPIRYIDAMTGAIISDRDY